MDRGRIVGLGIESTAHTFGASVMTEKGAILSNVKDVYRPPAGSGIHPRDASRHHSEVAPSVIKRALSEAGVSFGDLSFVAYSAGPGLGPCLKVGATLARFISSYYRKPIIPVHHGVGHVELGMLLTGAVDPLVVLISGGHTMLLARAGKRWRVFGETLDITLGQLIDQFGRAIGLPSPAGPLVEDLAKKGRRYVSLPYIVKGNDLSYSGIISEVKRIIKKESPEDLAFSVQETAFSMLAETSERALALLKKSEVMVVGGVAANTRLREMLDAASSRHGAQLKVVPPAYAGDCGAQIAWVGHLYFLNGVYTKPENAWVDQSWRIDEVDLAWS